MKTSLRLFCCAFAITSLGCTQTAVPVLEYVSITPAQPRLGEVATVRFVVKDYRGEALAGANIGFRLKTELPGVSLSPTTASSLKGTGYVETQLLVTSRVTSVVVVASSPPCDGPCTGDELEVESPALSFAGATVPNAKQFTFQCGPISGSASGGVHAIGAFDPTRYLIAGVKVKCFAHTGDRNGDGVADALVSFIPEAGTIGPTDTTKTDVVGNAEILYKTSYPLPRETDPVNWTWVPLNDSIHTGEYVAPLWLHPFDWTSRPILSAGMVPNQQEPRRRDPMRKTTAGGNITNNIRDNLVSMVAVTSGEEGYIDVNNNGNYDQGEPFDDLTEPFVDTNDNGTWESDERYIDTNGNGTWDGKNDKWDSSTLIWVNERIIWTGYPTGEDLADTVDPIFKLIEPPPGTTPTVPFLGSIPVQMILCDPWLNSIAQNGDGDACALSGVDDKSVVTTFPRRQQGGTRFTYPSCPMANFWVKDARDPLVVPIPRYPFPIAWVAPLCCEYTASPQEGHKANVCVTTLQGFVEP